MKRLAIIMLLLGLALPQTGCKTGKGYAGPERKLRDELNTAEAEKARAERELEKLKTEKTVEVPVAAPGELTKPKEPSILLDLAAVNYLLDRANAAAEKEDIAAGSALLDRAAAALEETIASLPRMRMASHCERALALLGKGDVLGASGEMERARQVDFNADPVTLGPDLEQDILDVRLKIEAGKAKTTAAAIEDVLEKLGGSNEEKALSRALACARAAKGALERKAFVAATAEISVARGALAGLKEDLQQAKRPGELLPAAAAKAREAKKAERPASASAQRRTRKPPEVSEKPSPTAGGGVPATPAAPRSAEAQPATASD